MILTDTYQYWKKAICLDRLNIGWDWLLLVKHRLILVKHRLIFLWGIIPSMVNIDPHNQGLRVFSWWFLFDGLKGLSCCKYIVAFDIDIIFQPIRHFVLPTYLVCSPIWISAMLVQLFSLCSLSALQNSLEWATFWYVKFRSDKRSTALAQLCSRKQFALRSAYRGLIQETMGWEIAGLIGMSSDGQAFHQNKSWAQDWHDPQGAVTFLLLVLMESLLAKLNPSVKQLLVPLEQYRKVPNMETVFWLGFSSYHVYVMYPDWGSRSQQFLRYPDRVTRSFSKE